MEARLMPTLLQFRNVRNNASLVGFIAGLTLVNVLLFIDRLYHCWDAPICEKVARACGQCLNLNSVLLLVLMQRRVITWLRGQPLGAAILPLDKHVYLHKLAGWSVMILSIVHTIAHISNYVQLSMITDVSLYDYMLSTKLNIGWFLGTANHSGYILLGILFVIGLASHRSVRRSGFFEVFYWTHLLCVPFWVLLILHGKNFWVWFVGPGLMFLVEQLTRLYHTYSGFGKTEVVAYRLLPFKVVELVIRRPPDWEFQAGDYIYLNIPSIARCEWHPFTLSSAPEFADIFTVHIRAVGGWTYHLHNFFQKVEKEEKEKVENRPELEKHSSLYPTFVNSENDSCSSDHSEQSSTSGVSSLDTKFRINEEFAENTVIGGEDNRAYQWSSEEDDNQILKQLEANVHRHSAAGLTMWLGDVVQLNSKLQVYVDGPYGAPSTGIWQAQHAILIAGGIGATPFASILQSIMWRYLDAMRPCPHCHQPQCVVMPSSLLHLRKVDFVWVNRDMRSFEWFLELLGALEAEQKLLGSAMETFMRLHLFRTGPKGEAIPGLATPVQSGRPNWDQLFSCIKKNRVGKITVFYCGPPALRYVVRNKCMQHGFRFKRELF